jgi:hypothetical protein
VTKLSLIASRFPAHENIKKITNHQIRFSSLILEIVSVYLKHLQNTPAQICLLWPYPRARHCFVSMQITTCDMAIVVTRANLTMQPKFLSLKLSERVSCSLSAAAAHARAVSLKTFQQQQHRESIITRSRGCSCYFLSRD